MKRLTVDLTDREADILATLCGMDVDVPRVVVNGSAMHAEERKWLVQQTGKSAVTLRREQKQELVDLLHKIAGGRLRR